LSKPGERERNGEWGQGNGDRERVCGCGGMWVCEGKRNAEKLGGSVGDREREYVGVWGEREKLKS